MVGLLLIHESGHALAMLRLGIPTGPMVFIPFMGAVVRTFPFPVLSVLCRYSPTMISNLVLCQLTTLFFHSHFF
jgi:hypothetical protein